MFSCDEPNDPFPNNAVYFTHLNSNHCGNQVLVQLNYPEENIPENQTGNVFALINSPITEDFHETHFLHFRLPTEEEIPICSTMEQYFPFLVVEKLTMPLK